MSLRLRNKIWLENEAGQTILGEGRMRIFCAIRRTGSILKAAQALGLPYRNVWAKIKDAEKQCGFTIVETSSRGSRLTSRGEQLVRKYDELQRTCKRLARAKFRKLFSSDELGLANPEAEVFLCEPRIND